MRVLDPSIKGGTAGSETGSSASWACVVGGQPLSSWGGAYSFGGGACGEVGLRLRGVKRGGDARRSLEWLELPRLPGVGSQAVRHLPAPGWRPHGN